VLDQPLGGDSRRRLIRVVHVLLAIEPEGEREATREFVLKHGLIARDRW
jgi:hypothetical protein